MQKQKKGIFNFLLSRFELQVWIITNIWSLFLYVVFLIKFFTSRKNKAGNQRVRKMEAETVCDILFMHWHSALTQFRRQKPSNLGPSIRNKTRPESEFSATGAEGTVKGGRALWTRLISLVEETTGGLHDTAGSATPAALCLEIIYTELKRRGF